MILFFLEKASVVAVYLGVKELGQKNILVPNASCFLNTFIFDNGLPRSVSQGFLMQIRAVARLTSAPKMFLEDVKCTGHQPVPATST